MPHQISVEGKSYMVDDLTLDEVAMCEDEVGESWLQANPYRSAKWARAITVRFLARTLGEDEAKTKAGSLSIKDALAGIEVIEDDRPVEHTEGVPSVDPKADTDGSATTG